MQRAFYAIQAGLGLMLIALLVINTCAWLAEQPELTQAAVLVLIAVAGGVWAWFDKARPLKPSHKDEK